MFRRILRVFILDADVFEEVGLDESATWQALLIVSIVALLAGISGAIRAAIFAVGSGVANAAIGLTEGFLGDIVPFAFPSFNPINGFFNSLIGVYVAWLLWALVTWLIGEYVYKGESNFGEMLRILGFAMAPRVIGALAFIPGVGWIAGLIGWIWALIAGFIGIRQGLGISNGKTILTIVLSLIAIFVINQFVVGPLLARIF